MNVIVNIFVAIGAGIVASGIVVAIYEVSTAPKLRVDVDDGPRAQGARQGERPDEIRRFEFYHVKVRNIRCYVPFLMRKPAWASSATIEVLDPDGKRVVEDVVHGRWAASPEPVVPALGPAYQEAALSTAGTTALEIKPVYANLLDVGRLFAGRKVDIHPHEDQRLAVVIKYEGEADCYLFSNESYQDPWWKVPAWRIPPGTYRLRITLYSPRGRHVAEFALANAGASCNDVTLDERPLR